MRSFYLSIFLFIILVIGIISNAVYVIDSSEYLKNAAESLTKADGREENLYRLEEFWSKNQELINISVSNMQLDGVGKIIVSLRCAHEADDESEFLKNCALLGDAADELCRAERLSIGTVF